MLGESIGGQSYNKTGVYTYNEEKQEIALLEKGKQKEEYIQIIEKPVGGKMLFSFFDKRENKLINKLLFTKEK